MNKKIIIDANFNNDIRVALINNNNIIESIDYETSIKQDNKGNIYLAKIIRVEPSLQAAFIDYGNEKNGFLPFNEIHCDYYKIPASDQKNFLKKLKVITPPEITSEDVLEKSESKVSYTNKDTNINSNNAFHSEFNLEIEDTEIDSILKEKNDENNNLQKQYKIQDVIKKGQILLVQLTKSERGNKGAAFSTYITLAGKYCILMPNKPLQSGVSRKIDNSDERKRLKEILNKLITHNDSHMSSAIIRTAGIYCTTLDIKKDFDYLVRLWNKIREKTLKATAASFIHEEDGIIQRTIRDMFNEYVLELIIQGTTAYNNAIQFMKDILPNEINKIREYKESIPIFNKYNIENQWSTLYQPVVYLSSGGYIVINPTEALISIDVNSGKSTSERNIEKTALKTNLEAAKSIADQIKLRNISGLIVVDFIDMIENKHKKIVEKSLKDFLNNDKAKIQISNINNFGLLEISRQRIKPSFLESNSVICSHCLGKGIVRANEPNAILILRTIENELCNDQNIYLLNIFTCSTVALFLLNNKRIEISNIETKYNIKININIDLTSNTDSFAIEKIKQKNNLNDNKSSLNFESSSKLQNKSNIKQVTKKNKKTEVLNKD